MGFVKNETVYRANYHIFLVRLKIYSSSSTSIQLKGDSKLHNVGDGGVEKCHSYEVLDKKKTK